MTDADAFKPLLPSARDEIARQINEVEPDAAKLVALGFGWSLAVEITRQMVGGGNPGLLQSFGLSAQVAQAIGIAVDKAIEARTPAIEPEPIAHRTMRGMHMVGRHAVR
jgi:hypothetical protein